MTNELKRNDEYNDEHCPRCKSNKWLGIPDSFIIEDSKISGIIPKGTKTKLVQGIFGNYYFEKVVR